MPATAGHRRFAAAWDWLASHEGAHERRVRASIVGKVEGHVLEIGYGVGSNWAYLPDAVKYVGIEPDPYMRARAERHVPPNSALDLRDGDAQALEFDDNTFDTVIGTLVLCTIPDPSRALAEIRRVLRPGGKFVFWEHVNARHPVARAVLSLIAPAWSRLGGGCHPNRATQAAIEAAGFSFEELRPTAIGPLPAIIGVARPSGTASS